MKTMLFIIWSSFAFAGSYTPTVSNVQYSYAITSHKAVYSVANGVVHVAGAVTATFDDAFLSASPSVAKMLISLPVSSSLGSQYDCAGVVGEGPLYNIGHIEADAASDKALLVINPSLSATPPDEAPLTLRYEFDCDVL
jgi:hypothetical protein